MLELAIKARLPLIGVTTNDEVHAHLMIQELTGSPVKQITGTTLNWLKSGDRETVRVLVSDSAHEIDYNLWYKELVGDYCVVVVNPPPSAAVFHGGVLTCPESLIRKFLKSHLSSALVKDFDPYVQALKGLTYMEIKEVYALSIAQYGHTSIAGLREVRRHFKGELRGLYAVNTDIGYYYPPSKVIKWLSLDGKLFTGAYEGPLTPRGLLFSGPAGTGKTMSAKYIARELNVPLYLLNVGALMGKYYGESEQGLQLALEQAGTCAPAVLLLDEVEKIFSGDDENGVMRRLLAHLLWWLEEHSERLLTIMTTNDTEVIPPELIRPGRIDVEFKFEPLNENEAQTFYLNYLKTLLDEHSEEYCEVVTHATLSGSQLTPAEIVRTVHDQIKVIAVKKLGE